MGIFKRKPTPPPQQQPTAHSQSLSGLSGDLFSVGGMEGRSDGDFMNALDTFIVQVDKETKSQILEIKEDIEASRKYLADLIERKKRLERTGRSLRIYYDCLNRLISKDIQKVRDLTKQYEDMVNAIRGGQNVK